MENIIKRLRKKWNNSSHKQTGKVHCVGSV